MSQSQLFKVKVRYESDSTALFDGADLKRIARGDDGRDYACKRMEDGPAVPISEWVGYHLWRSCGLLTPEFAVLHYDNGAPPAFGSRLELLASQVQKNPAAYTASGFFRPHLRVVSLVYPLDAFYINPDRHGRNFLERPTLTAPELLSFDYSRAWATNGHPWGDEQKMHQCNSADWWRFFRNTMQTQANFDALDRAAALDAAWLETVLFSAPAQWLSPINTTEAVQFWNNSRTARAEFAKAWAQMR